MSEQQTTSEYRASSDGSKMRLQTGIPVESAEAKPAPSPYRTGGVASRVVMRDGVVSQMETSQATGGNAALVTAPTEAFAMSAQGTKVTLDRASAKDVLDIPGWGTSSAESFETMGVVRRLPTGGYEWIGAPAVNPRSPVVAAPNAETPAPSAKAEEAPVDLTDVQPTSDSVDATLTTLRNDASVRYEAMIHQAATGREVDFAGIAQELGLDDGGASVEEMATAHREAGLQVLRNVDPTINPEAFERFLTARPDEASAIVRAMLEDHNPAPLAKAAREYSKQRTEKLEAMVEARVTTQRLNGKLYISRADLGLSPTTGVGDFRTSVISLAQAIRDGHVTVSE